MIKLSSHFTYKKIIKFTLPSIAMMMFTSIYGIVDGLFVSNFAGDIPFKAINLIMPFLMILGTVGFMFGTGGTAIVAKKLGEWNLKKANEYFSLFTYITLILGIIFSILGIVFMKPISILLGAEGEILNNCILYGRIILLALPFLVLQYLFQSFMIAAEKPKLGLYVTIIAGCTNMILDAILVMFLPKELKIAGAAIATAFSQFLGGVIPLIYFLTNKTTDLKLGKTKFQLKPIVKACFNGSSEFMSNVSMNIVGMIYNLQLIKYAGDDGIAAYGVMMYVSFIFASTFIGYSIGCAPIVSYNFGAKNFEELKNIRRKGIILVGITGLLMVLVAELFAIPFSKMFVSYNQELLKMTVHGFRIFAISFPFMGYAIFGSCFFTALNDGITSAIISFLRTLVFQIAAVIFLPLIYELDGIWASVVVAELFAVIFTILFLIIKRKKYNY